LVKRSRFSFLVFLSTYVPYRRKKLTFAISSSDEFLYLLFTARRYVTAVYAVIVCLSVRPSVRLYVTIRSSSKTAKSRITPTTPYILPKISAKFQWGHPHRERQIQVSRLNRRLSTNILLYLRNGAW